MTIVGEAFVAFRPEARNFKAEAERSVLGPVTDIAKKITTLIGGAFVVKKGLDFLGGTLDVAREANKVNAQTAAVIASTGGAANVTAKDLDSYTKSLQNLTGVDDVVIQQGANMLLTFTNVRNEVGAGNDVYNQATKTLLDMSVAMGTDMKGQAIQLGKALNDPIAGVSALAEVGVTFTAQQKEQIKTLVESGKTLDA